MIFENNGYYFKYIFIYINLFYKLIVVGKENNDLCLLENQVSNYGIKTCIKGYCIGFVNGVQICQKYNFINNSSYIGRIVGSQMCATVTDRGVEEC